MVLNNWQGPPHSSTDISAKEEDDTPGTYHQESGQSSPTLVEQHSVQNLPFTLGLKVLNDIIYVIVKVITVG